MTPATAIRALFVYGTLRPGDVRWSVLAPYTADDGVDDTAAGRMYDTGRGYPAATFGGGGRVHGRTYALRVDRLDEALAELDEEEGTEEGLFRRVTVTTGRGIIAWAYEDGTGLRITRIDGGDWFRR